MITIDGSFGEGGGQILRSSLTLSAITGEPVRLVNVRANRARPGLLRQHLTALSAVVEICGGRATGAELGSGQVTLHPGSPRPGHYTFAVGSAGSANLVLQTVLPILLHLGAPSTVTIQGGTHNPGAPPFDFLAECFFPAFRKIGHTVHGQVNTFGYFPAGGGEVYAEVGPPGDLTAFDAVERGEERSRSLEALLSNLPGDIAKRELQTASAPLGIDHANGCTIRSTPSKGPGNVLLGRLGYAHGTTVMAQFGEKNISAEQVAMRLAKQMKTFAASTACIDHHLADQLLLPMALAKGGAFSTLRPSPHATT